MKVYCIISICINWRASHNSMVNIAAVSNHLFHIHITIMMCQKFFGVNNYLQFHSNLNSVRHYVTVPDRYYNVQKQNHTLSISMHVVIMCGIINIVHFNMLGWQYHRYLARQTVADWCNSSL